MNNTKIRNKRKKFREQLEKNGERGAYKRDEYKQLIRSSHKTLHKYWSQLNYYFNSFYLYCSWFKQQYLKLLLGKKRLYQILHDNDNLTINEIYKLFKWLNLKKDFSDYLIAKTHFCYNLYNQEIKARTIKYNSKTLELRIRVKFAEFVYLILSEYIILHNWMWVSKLKIKGTTHLDKWVRGFK